MKFLLHFSQVVWIFFWTLSIILFFPARVSIRILINNCFTCSPKISAPLWYAVFLIKPLNSILTSLENLQTQGSQRTNADLR